MQLKIVPGYEGGISSGQRQKWTFSGSGPASYSQTTGDVLSLPNGVYIDDVGVCMDTTHTYLLVPYPSVVGTTRATWSFKWYTAAGMTEVTGAVNLSTFSVQFGAWGGGILDKGFSAAAIGRRLTGAVALFYLGVRHEPEFNGAIVGA